MFFFISCSFSFLWSKYSFLVVFFVLNDVLVIETTFFFLVKMLDFFCFQLCGGMFIMKYYVVKLGIAPNVTLFAIYNHSDYTTKTSQCII